MNVTFLHELFSSIAERGRGFLAAEPQARRGVERIAELCRALLSSRGEASGIALGNDIALLYGASGKDERLRFFQTLKNDFGPDRTKLREAAQRYLAKQGPAEEHALMVASEPHRQELLRRINLATGNTARLVQMRADLLALLKDHPDLGEVDADFAHLFSSWFNRGFLMMRRIDWSTSALILERIMRYEQVHAINGWDDLRRRIDPVDRRCYAFFHPALCDEPLIFVEVALTRDIPATIAPLLAETHEVVPPAEQSVAVFYSISNTQEGLRGVSFGNFLIKQVAEELKRELPSLKTFVTLSPVPGFAAWVGGEADAKLKALLAEPDWHLDRAKTETAREALLPLAARYFLEAKNAAGKPVDPVARFHLGNGAKLERLNWLGDTSAKGLRQSHGLMVNYLYALPDIERNHEVYSNKGVVTAAPAVKALLR